MTAEVGILNRMGVALAADSAVTIGGGGMEKVYNSANKLFSLSKHHPIGIMIYGGANFMGTPWETIIKTYRAKLKDEKKAKLKEYCDDFVQFVQNDLRLHNESAERDIVQNAFREAFMEILNEVELQINDEIAQGGATPDKATVESWIASLTMNFIENIKGNKQILLDQNLIPFEIFKEKHQSNISDVISGFMKFDLTSEVNEQLYELAYFLMISDIFSNNSTGVVIAGYGEDEIFPSLYEYQVEGIICNHLKVLPEVPSVIGAYTSDQHSTATIIPFAQKDMVYSFTYGIDPYLENKLNGTLNRILDVYPELVQQRIQTALTEDDKNAMKDLGRNLLSTFRQEVSEVQREKFIKPLVDIVNILPKEELAAMAEALVNLTSFKRRVSIEAETVGGPIDVAVITKGDGLVWIKRKHYFNPDLNYHFFQNYMRSGEDGNQRAFFNGK
ncbi:hypothetical protein [Priestia megaterium]|uniref:hypothetical protein n=1 Tax=Priestia megaterium TaxID=1404 RepID=UPI0011A51B90|nr:hypothetical protein [Priestia megaterium]